MSSASSFYVLPKSLINVIIGAFLVSLTFNIISVCVVIPNLIPSFVKTKDSPHKVSFVPIDIRPVAMQVGNSEHYGLNDSSDWDSIFPSGHGFVYLPQNNDTPPNEGYYAISMYHQLHCLNGFRRLAINAEANNVTELNIAHAKHCLSYLRQSILCQADTALEPATFARTVKGGTTQAVHGYGTTHLCRDWTQVREWAEKNYLTWAEQDKFEVSEGLSRQSQKQESDWIALTSSM